MARKRKSRPDLELPEQVLMELNIKRVMRKWRLAHGWNQQTMATHVGVTHAQYQQYERPTNLKRKVPTIVLRRFCEMAHFTMESVCDGHPIEKPRIAA